MAPWSSKLLSSSSRNEQGLSPAGAGAASPARPRGEPTRVTEADILENAYGIPTLPAPAQTKGRRGHGRSVSHPFPSIFSGKKKKQDDTAGHGGFESTDDEKVSPALVRSTALNPAARPARVPDKDLMKGNCMTCDCMVRWPKELKVFRCTVCMMVNDLKPVLLEARRGDGHRAPVAAKAGTYPGATFFPKGAFDSISQGAGALSHTQLHQFPWRRLSSSSIRVSLHISWPA
jgi:E3 ubiquitin-protein ligase HECTD2